jgi:response regulator RpfG family c-di-GMP phosphodiesterase
MVLLDKNLRPSEIAEIFQKTLAFKSKDFFDQTLPATFEAVRHDVDILVDYLRIEPERILDLVGHCHARCIADYKKANVAIVGLGMCFRLGDGFDFDRLSHVALGLLLADAGMAKIPKFVIDKVGGLRVDERKKVECHTQVGLDLLAQFTVLEAETVAVVTEHHERLDGSGYPKRLRGDAISLLGRIGAVADSYCAMITDRIHATGMKPIEAAGLLLKDQRRYDQNVSSTLLKLLSEAGNRIKSRPKH